MDWQDLLYKENLTDDEIRQIPYRCGLANQSELKEIQELGLPIDEITRNTGLTIEELTGQNHWLNAFQTRQFDYNYCRCHPVKPTIAGYYANGRALLDQYSSAIRFLAKFTPARVLIKQTQKENSRFNNESVIEDFRLRPHSFSYRVQYYPFVLRFHLGHECHFVRGVIAGIFSMKGYRQVESRELMCAHRFRNLAEDLYTQYHLAYTEEGDRILLDGDEAARWTRLDEVRTEEFPEDLDGEHPVVLVTRDVVREGKTLFREGEIYNAPFCYVRGSWEGRNLLKDLTNRFLSPLFHRRSLIEQLRGQLEVSQENVRRAHQAKEQAEKARRDSEKKSRIFQIYTRQSLVEQVDAGQNPTQFSPRAVRKAVLFNDIRRFTTISEQLDSLRLVELLNSYFEQVNRIILDHGGEIDKIIGDCVMAAFSDPLASVQAALRIQESLAGTAYPALNALKPLPGEPPRGKAQPLASGVGITYGEVITANIGSPSKMDYTLIGDIVNAASRLEALTKEYSTPILVSEDLVTALPRPAPLSFRFIDTVLVKGKSEPLRIYTPSPA